MKTLRLATLPALALLAAPVAADTPTGGHAQLPPGISLSDVEAANAVEKTLPQTKGTDPFDDVQYWIGTGANRAALVIDFNDSATTEAWLWGYRWDGTATAEDMVSTIVTADPYLFWFESAPGSFGVSVFGFGYDADQDGGAFSFGGTLQPPATGPWDSSGADDVSNGPTDTDDQFASAWLSGDFWGLLLSSDSGVSWAGASTGITGHTLTNDEWIGLSFGGFPSPDPSAWQAATAPPASVKNWALLE